MLRRRPFIISTRTVAAVSSSLSSSSSFFLLAPTASPFTATRSAGGKLRQQKDNSMPDRLRDAFAFYGSDVARAEGDDGENDIPYRSPDQRKQMMQGLMGMHSHTISLSSLDKVRTALDAVRRRPPEHDDWLHLNELLRTAEMCIELVPEPTDKFPPGDKCWVHLSETEVRRRPYVLHLRECGNTFCVLPVFTQEEYMTHYFQRMKAHDACWFPTPRMGSQRKEFVKNRFPVCAHGPLAKLCALAISMPPSGADETFLMCINPFQQSTKFICYPEMVRLAKSEKERAEKEKDKRAHAKIFGAERMQASAMFPRAPSQQQQQQGAEAGAAEGKQDVAPPETISQITSRMQERHAEMQHQQNKLLKQMDGGSGKLETRAEKRERLLAEAEERKKEQEQLAKQQQQKQNGGEDVAAEGDILFSPPKPQAPSSTPAAAGSSADSGKRLVAELNERDKITRETLRKIKMSKVTPADGSTAPDIHFAKIFDTTKWWGRRMTPDEAMHHATGEIPFPEVEELQKKVERQVPNVGKTVAQEQQEHERELSRLSQKKRAEETPEEKAAREKREEEAFLTHAMNTDSSRMRMQQGPFEFSKEALLEKLPEFHKMKKPPPPKRRRLEDDFKERAGKEDEQQQQQKAVTIDLSNRDIVAALSDVVLEHQSFYANKKKNKNNSSSSSNNNSSSDEKQQQGEHQQQQEQKVETLWRFPVHVPVPRDVLSFWNERVQSKGLDPRQHALRGVRVPRIALDELLLLLFDIPEVKIIAARLALAANDKTGRPEIRLRIAVVTTDPLTVIEDVLRREQQQHSDAKQQQEMEFQRAMTLTQTLEAGAADGRARVELTWSFPKNKSNSPYPVEFVSMTTTEFFEKLEHEKQQQQQQPGQESSSYAILYDRIARGGGDMNAAKVIGHKNLREELDYDGEDMDVTEWHKPDRPFTTSRSM